MIKDQSTISQMQIIQMIKSWSNISQI